jgi:hypothetical protein
MTMATTWLMSCGHSDRDETSGPDREETLRRPCYACRQKRIGQAIRFLRFGDVPESGESFNHRDRTAEEGVSVYEIAEGRAEMTGFYFGFLDRPAYRGTGVIVGWGSDGEPLVSQVSRLRRIGPKEVARLTGRG